MAHTQDKYYVPHGTRWPVFASMGLAITFIGVALLLNGNSTLPVILTGTAIVLVVVFRWFADVVNESEAGTYGAQVDRSFRMGMIWFILSEVMFFACFFGALYYARQLALPWLGGIGSDPLTNSILWPGFDPTWPSNGPGHIGGEYESMPAWGIPALNTAILLSSGVTLTIAHHALKDSRRGLLAVFLALTVLLGFAFLGFQVYE